MDKLLRIDVGAEGGPASKVEPLGDYAGLGGRALTSAGRRSRLTSYRFTSR